MVGSLFLGNALPELQTFATAVGSAAGVFDVMDHVSYGQGQYSIVHGLLCYSY